MENDEKWPGDAFNLKPYSIFLTNYLLSKDKPFTINIDSEWGTGKSFFISKWHNEIKNKYISIIFNAWENDYSNDPLISILTTITFSLRDLLPQKKSIDAIDKFISKAGILAKNLTPIIAKSLTQKYLGQGAIEDISSIFESESTEFNENEEGKDEHNKENIKLAGEISEKAAAAFITTMKRHANTETQISDFKEELGNLIRLVAETTNLEKPVFLFIDELDRCRPLFAIELLEKVKHLFDIPEIRFIIATDTDQLGHSIKAIYGHGFNSRKYLRRFFDHEYKLPSVNYVQYTTILFKDFKGYNIKTPSVNIYGCDEENSYSEPIHCIKLNAEVPNANLVMIFSALSNCFGLDLRTKNQCYERLEAISSNLPNQKKYDSVYLIILLMLKAQHPERYLQYTRATVGKIRRDILT
jgi:predicted KAP-like P-loop ATPase